MSNYCKTGMSLEEIQQNKKIVAELINEYTQLGNVADSFTKKINNKETALYNQELASQKRDLILLKRDHLSKIIKKATGRDINKIPSIWDGKELKLTEKRFDYLKSLQSEDMSAENYQEYLILKELLHPKHSMETVKHE